MPTTFPAPEQYTRFVSLVRHHAPDFPIHHQSELQRNRSANGRALAILQVLADGLGISIDPMVGVASSGATANNAGDFANSMVDTAATMGGQHFIDDAAGPFIGGGIMLARGASQALDRSDAMVSYLLGTGGFTNTLSRLCVLAMREPFPYTRMPIPSIPDYVRRTGDIFSDSRRQAYMAGFEAAATVIRELDNLRPTRGDSYSKCCLIYIGVQTGYTGRFVQNNGRLRRACERIIIRDILATNLRARATQLRHWANAP